MKICLKPELKECLELPVEPQGKIKLPAKEIVLVDSCILVPAAFPPKKRNVETITKLGEETSKYSMHPLVLRCNRKYNERRIQLVNSMENGEFHRRGLYPGITSAVNGELYHLQKVFGTDHLEIWMKKMEGRMHYVTFNLKPCRD